MPYQSRHYDVGAADLLQDDTATPSSVGDAGQERRLLMIVAVAGVVALGLGVVGVFAG